MVEIQSRKSLAVANESRLSIPGFKVEVERCRQARANRQVDSRQESSHVQGPIDASVGEGQFILAVQTQVDSVGQIIQVPT